MPDMSCPSPIEFSDEEMAYFARRLKRVLDSRYNQQYQPSVGGTYQSQNLPKTHPPANLLLRDGGSARSVLKKVLNCQYPKPSQPIQRPQYEKTSAKVYKCRELKTIGDKEKLKLEKEAEKAREREKESRETGRENKEGET